MAGSQRLTLAVIAVIVVVGLAIVWFYMGRGTPITSDPLVLVRGAKGSLRLASSAFSNGSMIPSKYSLEGEDLSPPLTWSGVPAEARSLVLIVFDPDAPRGTFYHWLLYNIPPSTTSLPEGVPKKGETPYGLQGRNDYGGIGYGGPYPPEGSRHRYVFLLMALDKELDLGPGASPSEVLKACEGHVIAYGLLVGYYER